MRTILATPKKINNKQEMKYIYNANGFSVVQSIYEEGGDWFLKDYEGTIYNFEDVTNDGEVFDKTLGWIQKFYLKTDIDIICDASFVIYCHAG